MLNETYKKSKRLIPLKAELMLMETMNTGLIGIYSTLNVKLISKLIILIQHYLEVILNLLKSIFQFNFLSFLYVT